MIRNIIIMNITGGIFLFSQEFPGSVPNPRSVGPLITAIIAFGDQTTGMAVSHIDLTNISIAIVMNQANNLFCAIFYDKADGKLFGRLICSEILSAFIQFYSTDPQFNQTGRNLKDFLGFQKKLQTVVYYSIRPVMSLLESKKGIVKALVVRDLEIIDSQKGPVNEFAILANIPHLIEIAEELLLYGNGFLQSAIIESDQKERLMIWKIREKCFVICLVDKTVIDQKAIDSIDESLAIVEQIYILHESLGILHENGDLKKRTKPIT